MCRQVIGTASNERDDTMKQFMKVLLAAVLIVTTSAAMAESKPEQKLDDATSVLRQFVNIPENAIPSALLRQAYGIAVIPSVIKVGFILGGRHGRGVLSVRTANGGWSNPVFISLTGGSIGWQAGASSTDIILVFKTQRSVDKIANGQFTLGADASVAAGPVGRSAGAATNGNFNAEVYSYSRSRGLFAGVSVEGGHLSIDQDADWLFYNQAGLDAHTILRTSKDSNIPKSGQRFVYTLNRYMPASNDKFNYGSDTGASNGRNSGSGQQQSAGSMSSQDSGSNADSSHGNGQTAPYNGGSDSGVIIRQRNSSDNGSGTSTPGGDYGSGQQQ